LTEFSLFQKQMSSGALSILDPSTCEALITLSIYNPITWSHGSLARGSQHGVLASQTLGNLFDIIPCPSREIPEEIFSGDHIVGYRNDFKQRNEGCVICIEQVAYGDGRSEVDYAKCVIVVFIG
jgi:snRNA-activating protein complex subunit 3